MKKRDVYTKEREPWIELLRIISMLWIIAFHFSDHGTIDMIKEPLSLNWIILAFSRVGGGIGNCIFVLISGYLLYNRPFRVSRIIILWVEVEFYSLISYMLSIAFGIAPWNISALIQSIFPIVGRNYWFISSYLLVYILSPFINRFIKYSGYIVHRTCIYSMIFCFSFLQTIPYVHWMGSDGKIEIFIVLYLIGALIKKYDLFYQNKWKIKLVTIGTIFSLITSEIVIKFFAPEYFTFFVWPMNKISVIIASVLIFVSLKEMTISLPSRMLRCSRSVFGVYLIHIGRMKKWFFQQQFDISVIYGKNTVCFLVTFICYILIIFALCILIDWIRNLCIEKPLKPVIDQLSNGLEKCFATINGKPNSVDIEIKR